VMLARLISVDYGRFGRRDESHFGKPLHKADVVLKYLICSLGFLGSLRFWQHPFFARRIGSVGEIGPVPKLIVNKFARMVHDAERAAALGTQLLSRFKEAFLGRLVLLWLVDVRAYRVR